MCGIHGLYQLDGTRADAEPGWRAWATSPSIAVPTTTARMPTAAAPSACGACRSSICPAVTSRSPTPTARWSWSATARSTTSASCARELQALGPPLPHATPTARSCCTATRSGASASSSGSTACSASRSGTRAQQTLLVGRDRLGHQADLLARRRPPRRVRLRGQGAARAARRARARSIRRRWRLPRTRLRAGAAVDVPRHPQAADRARLLKVDAAGRRRCARYWQPPDRGRPPASAPAEWVAARARAARGVGAHADGQRRADRRVPVRRHRLQRGARLHGAAQRRAGEDLLDRLRRRRGRALLQRARPRARGRARCSAPITTRSWSSPTSCSLLPKLLWHMDEPIADSAFVTTYLVAEFARRDVKVILSGVGGDELFGGYRRYLGEHYMRYLDWLPELGQARRGPAGRPGCRATATRKWLNYSRLAKNFLGAARSCRSTERYRAYVGVFSPARRAPACVQPPRQRFDALAAAFEARRRRRRAGAHVRGRRAARSCPTTC